MPDTFALTIIFIAVFTIIAAFIRGRTKDKCLKSFSENSVNLEEKGGKVIWGKLRVETTGMELVYSSVYKDKTGHDETSFILYKDEYPDIQALIRYHDELSEKEGKEREREMKISYHPTFIRRMKRKVQNMFKTVRDSIMEVVNLLIGQAKKAAPGGKVLASQDKYVTQIKKEVFGAMSTSFEPLLERYIGHKVILEMVRGDRSVEYSGVLKEYTADFIEIMDINYRGKEDDQDPRKADLVVPRECGIIRHLGE